MSDSNRTGYLYREEWLTRLAAQIKPLFGTYNVDTFRVTCGWPCLPTCGCGTAMIV